MVRSMLRRPMPLIRLRIPLKMLSAGVPFGGAVPMALAMVLAGCASGPAPSTAPGSTQASVPVMRPGPAPSRDRDGPPSDAPPNLAALPDPVPQIEPIKPGGPNKPYVVLGQAYEPTVADVSWKERGLASWYGTKFHGRRTASGELFSMYGLTAAHRTLPIPSYARVRHVGTGKEIIVRVNDRGPFHSARVMDLSYAAAVKLGITGAGSAQVEIERLTFDEIRSGAWRRGTVMDPNPTLAAASPVPMAPVAIEEAADPILQAAASGVSLPTSLDVTTLDAVAVTPGTARAYTTAAKGYWVQLAALGKRDGVERMQQRVATELSALQPLLAVFHEAAFFKLQVGPYGSRDQALAAAQQARDALQVTPMVIERR
jgi:rare lipoprotein A